MNRRAIEQGFGFRLPRTSRIIRGFALLLAAPASAQVTECVSVAPGGLPGNAESGVIGLAISGDGRYVAFRSAASDLVAGDTNGTWDLFLRDRASGTTEIVSVASDGSQGNGDSGTYGCAISPDGRFVAFSSAASNFDPGDTNFYWDIFVRDRQAGTTELVSVAAGGGSANMSSTACAISADGRYVAFSSLATDLVAGDTNGVFDIFVRDRQLGTTERVSIATGGSEANGESLYVSISADGRYVAFSSVASNLVSGDTNGSSDVFLRDRQNATTERVGVASGGTQGDGGSYRPSISADGRYVAFESNASNLVAGDTNGFEDVFVRDLLAGTTERVSISSTGVEENAPSGLAAISADGRCVAFESYASNLGALDTNGVSDIYLRDRLSGITERMSVATGGAETNAPTVFLSISGDGQFTAFSSLATNLAAGDTNGTWDVFVRNRVNAGFASLCDPGVGGVLACPCSNPPSGPGRGCDNSGGTGGASLSASGAPYLSIDSLVFTTSGELPAATSIVVQGNAQAASGIAFGQGVRCAAGTLKRMYAKTAMGGSISAPDLVAGDPTVSARSATLGDTIQAGADRWYFVYYRDPIVLGGCPQSSTFNATQAEQVTWGL